MKKNIVLLLIMFIFLLSSCSNKSSIEKLSDYYSWSSDLKIEDITKVELEIKSLGTGPNTQVNKYDSDDKEDIKYNFNLLNSQVYKKKTEYIDGGSSKTLIFYTNSNSYRIESINGFFKSDNEYSYYILDDFKIEH